MTITKPFTGPLNCPFGIHKTQHPSIVPSERPTLPEVDANSYLNRNHTETDVLPKKKSLGQKVFRFSSESRLKITDVFDCEEKKKLLLSKIKEQKTFNM